MFKQIIWAEHLISEFKKGASVLECTSSHHSGSEQERLAPILTHRAGFNLYQTLYTRVYIFYS